MCLLFSKSLLEIILIPLESVDLKLLLEDQQLLMILSFEWVLKVKNVGVYVQQIQDRRVHGIGAAHGYVSKFYKR